MRFDREMDSKPAQEPSLRKDRPTAVHLMAISNIARLDTGEVTAGLTPKGAGYGVKFAHALAFADFFGSRGSP